jgi:hypothetical protein
VNRTHVLTMQLTTDDAKTAMLLRRQLKRVAGTCGEAVGVRVTSQTQDGPTISDPIVLMERTVE